MVLPWQETMKSIIRGTLTYCNIQINQRAEIYGA